MNQCARDAALFMGREAIAQDYTLDTVVRYRNAPDNSQVSDTFKVDIRVIPSS